MQLPFRTIPFRTIPFRTIPFACISLLLWAACDTTQPPQSEPKQEATVTVVDSSPQRDKSQPTDTKQQDKTPPIDRSRPKEPKKEPSLTEPTQDTADAGTPKEASPKEASPKENKPDSKLTGLTYWKDIKEIVDYKCVNCHNKGGIGPFAMEDYKSIKALKFAIKAEVKAGRMPPWQADRTCGEYTNDISLSTMQKAKILQWIDQGAIEGDPNTYKKPPPAPPIGLKRVDLTLSMKKTYKIAKSPDEYRCFVTDWTPKMKKYITGFQIKAGNPKIVHHVIAYLARKNEAAHYLKKDPSGNGYSCYGTAGGPAAIRWLGVWAPGIPGGIYPKGTGIRVEPGAKIIIQVHYNTIKANTETDKTQIDFTLEDSVQKEAILLPYTNPRWLRSKKMKIPANAKMTEHTYSLPLQFLGLISSKIKHVKVYNAMLHMHQLGSSGRLFYGRNQCFVNIPKWDFNWQMAHQLKKPVELTLNDSLGITCRWNNSQANQPIIDGKQKKSADVYWGDGTHDEMCLGLVYITCSDGNKQTILCPDLSKYVKP